MILAAGRGERMRPLTDLLPKPLVVVRGAPLIEHHIHKLVAIGIRRIVINASYLANTLIAALGDGSRFGCDLIYSVEVEPLESGGGLATASRHFQSKVIALISADIYSDFDYAGLVQPAAAIEKCQSKAHFVLVPSVPFDRAAQNMQMNRSQEKLYYPPILEWDACSRTTTNAGCTGERSVPSRNVPLHTSCSSRTMAEWQRATMSQRCRC